MKNDSNKPAGLVNPFIQNKLVEKIRPGKSHTPEHMALEEDNKEIDEALAEIERDEVYSHDDLIKWRRTGNDRAKTYLDKEDYLSIQ